MNRSFLQFTLLMLRTQKKPARKRAIELCCFGSQLDVDVAAYRFRVRANLVCRFDETFRRRLIDTFDFDFEFDRDEETFIVLVERHVSCDVRAVCFNTFFADDEVQGATETCRVTCCEELLRVRRFVRVF